MTSATYKVTFLKSAQKEWDKIDYSIKKQFKKKLDERVIKPYIQKDKLSGIEGCYKIKLKTSGYRLDYKVIQDRLVIQVIVVGRRDKSEVYEMAMSRV